MTASKPKTAPTRVTMSDGTVVEFPTRIKMRKTAAVDEAGQIVCRLDFADGTVRMAPMPENFLRLFAAEGIKARFAAAVASAESIAEMIKATDDLQALWGSGRWEEERPVQERPLTDTEVLAHAITEVSGKPVEAMLEWVKSQTKASRVKMEADPRVAGIVARIRSEQAAKFNGGEASPLDGLLAA